MRAFITGGLGFAGSHLAEHLLERQTELVLMAHPRESLANVAHFSQHVRVERADLGDAPRIRQVLDDVRPDRIFHLAAFSSPMDSLARPRDCYESNFTGTLNLLDAWRDLGFDSRFLLVSTSDVYGRVNDRPMPLGEDLPLAPANPYSASKAAAEFAGLQYYLTYGLPVVRVRPFHHTGPRQRPAFVCSQLARQAAEIFCGLREPVMTTGNPNVRRDFSDVRDIVKGYYLLLENGKPGEAYHLASGHATAIGEIAEALAAMAGIPVEVRVDPSKVRAGEAPLIAGDASKAREQCGWAPTVDLAKTLRDLETYWEQQLSATTRGASQGEASVPSRV